MISKLLFGAIPVRISRGERPLRASDGAVFKMRSVAGTSEWYRVIAILVSDARARRVFTSREVYPTSQCEPLTKVVRLNPTVKINWNICEIARFGLF